MDEKLLKLIQDGIAQLAELIRDQPPARGGSIQTIHISHEREDTYGRGRWMVWARVGTAQNNAWAYQYAMYIDIETGQIIADGF